jgi:hypothetical protein
MSAAFNDDFADMVAELTSAGAEFVVVGGFAVSAWGFLRATGDLDVFTRPTIDNAPRVYRALASFGAPLHALTIEDLVTPGVVFQIGVPPRRIDVLTAVDGIDFDEALVGLRRVTVGRVEVPFIGLAALVKNKLAANCPQDRRDVRELRKLHPTALLPDPPTRHRRRR